MRVPLEYLSRNINWLAWSDPGALAEHVASDELADSRLDLLRVALFDEGIVRDLRNGEWRGVFANTERTWHRRGKELLKKLALQNRIRRFPATLEQGPTCDGDWCNEALASHERQSLGAIITTDPIQENHRDQPLITSISKLSRAPWWAQRGGAVRLQRKIEDYLLHLGLLLQCANHLMFIDAHLDPSEPRYQDFLQLVQLAARRRPLPQIEIHRVCYVGGSGRNRQIIGEKEWESRFREALGPITRETGVKIEVYCWDDLHDRYLVSDIVGLSILNGFDTSRKADDPTTWTRLSRDVRDDIQREHDPASHRRKLLWRLKI